MVSSIIFMGILFSLHISLASAYKYGSKSQMEDVSDLFKRLNDLELEIKRQRSQYYSRLRLLNTQVDKNAEIIKELTDQRMKDSEIVNKLKNQQERGTDTLHDLTVQLKRTTYTVRMLQIQSIKDAEAIKELKARHDQDARTIKILTQRRSKVAITGEEWDIQCSCPVEGKDIRPFKERKTPLVEEDGSKEEEVEDELEKWHNEDAKISSNVKAQVIKKKTHVHGLTVSYEDIGKQHTENPDDRAQLKILSEMDMVNLKLKEGVNNEDTMKEQCTNTTVNVLKESEVGIKNSITEKSLYNLTTDALKNLYVQQEENNRAISELNRTANLLLQDNRKLKIKLNSLEGRVKNTLDKKGIDRVVQNTPWKTQVTQPNISFMKRATDIVPSQVIAFYAYIVDHQMINPSPGDVVRFDDVITNAGNCYNKNSGFFTCVKDGMYVFSWTIDVYSQSLFKTYLVRNGETIGYTESGYDSGNTGSNTVIIQLVNGDSVWVKVLVGGTGKIDGFESSFSGFLLK